MNIDNKSCDWIAVRLYRNQEMVFKEFVEAKGLDCYVPAREVKNGVRQNEIIPLFHNLAFVKNKKEELDELITEFQDGKTASYLRDPFRPEKVYNSVSEALLTDFRRVLSEDPKSEIITISPVPIYQYQYFDAEISKDGCKGVKGRVRQINRSNKYNLIVELCCNIAVQTSPLSPTDFKLITH